MFIPQQRLDGFGQEAALNHVDNIKSITSNVRFDFIIVTAVVNIGACGAVPAVAPKRTGSGPGIVKIISLWQLDSNKNIA